LLSCGPRQAPPATVMVKARVADGDSRWTSLRPIQSHPKHVAHVSAHDGSCWLPRELGALPSASVRARSRGSDRLTNQRPEYLVRKALITHPLHQLSGAYCRAEASGFCGRPRWDSSSNPGLSVCMLPLFWFSQVPWPRYNAVYKQRRVSTMADVKCQINCLVGSGLGRPDLAVTRLKSAVRLGGPSPEACSCQGWSWLVPQGQPLPPLPPPPYLYRI
jgi:hypothetical protein